MCTYELIEWKQVEWKIPEKSFTHTGFQICKSNSFTFQNVEYWLCIYEQGSAQINDLDVYLQTKTNRYTRPVNVSLSIKKLDFTLFGTQSFILKKQKYIRCIFNGSILRENKCLLMPSDILTIICDMKYGLDGESARQLISCKEIPLAEISEEMEISEPEVLSKNLKDLLADTDSCDTLLRVQNKEFNAHKIILIARSPVFASMFKHDTVERQTGTIDIPDCDPGSFKEFLEYLYSGKIGNVSFDSAVHLYKTSDKYNVLELKAACVQFMAQNLKVENLCEAVVLADVYEESMLFFAAQDFFNENTTIIFKSPEWKKLMTSNFCLANKLLIQMSESKSNIF